MQHLNHPSFRFEYISFEHTWREIQNRRKVAHTNDIRLNYQGKLGDCNILHTSWFLNNSSNSSFSIGLKLTDIKSVFK